MSQLQISRRKLTHTSSLQGTQESRKDAQGVESRSVTSDPQGPELSLGFGHAFAARSAAFLRFRRLPTFLTPPEGDEGGEKLRRPFGKCRDSPMASRCSVNGKSPISPPSRYSPSTNLALSASRNHGQTRGSSPPKKSFRPERAAFGPAHRG